MRKGRAHTGSCCVGDGVEQLLWRIQHGELPSQGQHHPKVVIVHVGTNGKSSQTVKSTATQDLGGLMQLQTSEEHKQPDPHYPALIFQKENLRPSI